MSSCTKDTHVNNFEIDLDDFPQYLKESCVLKSMIEDSDEEDEQSESNDKKRKLKRKINVNLKYLKKNDVVNTDEELFHLLDSIDFWSILDIPFTVYEYLLKKRGLDVNLFQKLNKYQIYNFHYELRMILTIYRSYVSIKNFILSDTNLNEIEKDNKFNTEMEKYHKEILLNKLLIHKIEYTNLVKFCILNFNCIISERSIEIMIERNKQNILKFIFELKFDESFTYLYFQDIPINDNICHKAIEEGNLEILKILHSHNYSIDKNKNILCLPNDYIDCFKYLHKNGQEIKPILFDFCLNYDDNLFYDELSKEPIVDYLIPCYDWDTIDPVNCLEYIINNCEYIEITSEHIKNCIKNNKINCLRLCLKYYKKNKPIENVDFVLYAVKNMALECLTILVDEFNYTLDKDILQFIEYENFKYETYHYFGSMFYDIVNYLIDKECTLYPHLYIRLFQGCWDVNENIDDIDDIYKSIHLLCKNKCEWHPNTSKYIVDYIGETEEDNSSLLSYCYYKLGCPLSEECFETVLNMNDSLSQKKDIITFLLSEDCPVNDDQISKLI